jgi:uncharacterized membrane protein
MWIKSILRRPNPKDASMRRLILLAALALGACGKSDSDIDPGRRPTQPDVAANFSQPIDARGAQPPWGLKIRGLQMTLDRPNQPDVVATAPGAVITAHTASWTAQLPDGRAMKINVYASVCSDGVSEAKYPFAAEVVLPDAAPLNGCAGPPAKGTR